MTSPTRIWKSAAALAAAALLYGVPRLAAGQEPDTTTPTAESRSLSLEGPDLQILLVRRGHVPGLIDGEPGPQTREALARFQEESGLPASGTLDDATREALLEDAPGETVVEYRITSNDADGPFGFEFPEETRKLKVLPPYGRLSLQHFLAKKFRTTPDFLRTLNPDADFREGEAIRVPNVPPQKQQL